MIIQSSLTKDLECECCSHLHVAELPRTLRDYKHEEGLKGEGGNGQTVSTERLAHLE